MIEKKKIIIIGISVICLIIAIFVVTNIVKKNIIEKGENAVILNDNVNFTKRRKTENVKLISELNTGDLVKLIKSYKTKDGTEWVKIGYNNKIGYVKKENVGVYSPQDAEYVLLSDVSKFNVIYEHFLTMRRICCFYCGK